MPHASMWDKGHTLSGTHIKNKRKKRKRKHRRHRQGPEEQHSQRSLLMKKLMDDKLKYLYASAGGEEKEEEEETRNRNPAVSGRSEVKLKYENYYSDDNESSCSSKKQAITEILRYEKYNKKFKIHITSYNDDSSLSC